MDQGIVSDELARTRLTQLLDRYIGRCTPELFLAYRPDVLPYPQPPSTTPTYTLAGIIGFVGDLSGTLLIGATPSVVSACHPFREKQALTERMQLDWIGELANQMLGRLKTRLSVHGLEIRFSAPISLAGERMRHVGAAGSTFRASFVYGTDTVDVWVDAEIKETVINSEAFYDDSREGDGDEGAVVFL